MEVQGKRRPWRSAKEVLSEEIGSCSLSPQANGIIKHGQNPIVYTKSKISDEVSTNLVQNFPMILLADWSNVFASSRLNSYHLNCTIKPVVFIQLELSTWQILPEDQVNSTSKLLASSISQLQRRDKNSEEAILSLQRMRLEEKKHHDMKHDIREEK